MICRTCKQPIARREVSPGFYVWGHVKQPGFMHHYAKPKIVR